jgi:pyruvate dehydrogenase E2 component (dihydrolipoamide acetyltransferase)
MAFEFTLPDLGEGIAEGEIRKWLVKAGDVVEEHQAVVEIETDKAVVEVPSPKKGTVLKLSREEGDTVQVGAALLVIGEPGEKQQAGEAAPVVAERPKSVSVVGELPEEEEHVVLATPAVRALAKEQGIALEKLKGSGPGGSVIRDDVLKASGKARKPEDQYGPVERIAVKGLRKTIAKNMVLAQKTTASVTETDEADVTELWELKEREKKPLKEQDVHLTFMPFIMKAVQHACREYASFNASLDDVREEIIIKKYFNIGVAVDTAEGLIVPVVRNVEKKTIRELAVELQDLGRKARERTVKLDELRGSTFTITNYGAFGAGFATPIINYPDAAILGTGRVSDKPWVRDGRITIRKILPLSLTFDHRVNDGAGAAKFMTKLVGYLEDPASLFIESA